jgi:hypothetical protein
MAKSRTPRRAIARRTPESTARRVWLAGIGAVSLGRKRALAAIDDAGASAGRARASVQRRIDAVAQGVQAAKAGVEAQVERVQAKAEGLAAEAAGRLQPLLAKVGVRLPVPASKAAKAKRTGARRPAKAAKGAAARTPAKRAAAKAPVRRRKAA